MRTARSGSADGDDDRTVARATGIATVRSTVRAPHRRDAHGESNRDAAVNVRAQEATEALAG